MAQHNESAFEKELCQALVDGGWLHSVNSQGYDRELALLLFAFVINAAALALYVAHTKL